MDNETINRKVHEALGFMHWHSPREADYKQNAGWVCGGCYMGFHRTTPNFGNPDYCNDLNAAFRFTDKLIADGKMVVIASVPEGWAVSIGGHFVTDTPPAKAICIAGLSALEVGLQPQPRRGCRDLGSKVNNMSTVKHTLEQIEKLPGDWKAFDLQDGYLIHAHGLQSLAAYVRKLEAAVKHYADAETWQKQTNISILAREYSSYMTNGYDIAREALKEGEL